MIPRTVVPEILDHLPADSPDAIRSRRDLGRINFLMGNNRRICRTVRRFSEVACEGIVEIGAGDGALANRLHRLFPEPPMEAYDLLPKPAEVAPGIIWHTGDLLAMPPREKSGGILIANLFLHHFEAPALAALGRWMAGFRVLVLSEPDRAALPLFLSGLMLPFVNHVTRHDMVVSIRAGFSEGELRAGLGLEPGVWKITENSTWRGARHMIAWRD